MSASRLDDFENSQTLSMAKDTKKSEMAAGTVTWRKGWVCDCATFHYNRRKIKSSEYSVIERALVLFHSSCVFSLNFEFLSKYHMEIFLSLSCVAPLPFCPRQVPHSSPLQDLSQLGNGPQGYYPCFPEGSSSPDREGALSRATPQWNSQAGTQTLFSTVLYHSLRI